MLQEPAIGADDVFVEEGAEGLYLEFCDRLVEDIIGQVTDTL